MRSITMALLGLLLVAQSFAVSHAQNVGIGTAVPQAKMHVAGGARVDSLSGTSLRVVQANPLGDLLDIPAGNDGEVLTQTTSGPQWEPMGTSGGGSSDSSACCLNKCGPTGTLPCPTEWSNSFTGEIEITECAIHCENLTDGGHTDWRVPTVEEVLLLRGQFINYFSSDYMLTNTVERSGGGIDYVVFRLNDGFIGYDNRGLCRCVR